MGLPRSHGTATKQQYAAHRREAVDLALGELRDVDVPGATEAYDIADHGVVGLIVDGRFAQLTVTGPDVNDDQHLDLAAALVQNLAG